MADINLSLSGLREEETAAEKLAKRLVTEQHLAEQSGNLIFAAQLEDELRDLSDTHPRSSTIFEMYVACLYNSHVKVTEPANKERGRQLLEQLRLAELSDRCTPIVIERYATALNNAHVRAGKWADPELGVFARAELARIAEDLRATSKVIEFYATSLSDGHSRVYGEGDKQEAARLIESLRQLSRRYPDNSLVGARLAKALANESLYAAREGDTVLVAENLDRLRAMCEGESPSAGSIANLALALSNVYIGLKEQIETPMAEALLQELRTLALSNRSASAVGGFAKSLRNKHYYLSLAGKFDAAEPALNELCDLERVFLGEPEVVKQVASALDNAHNLARKSHYGKAATGYLTTFRGLYERFPNREEVLNYFAHCVYNSHFESRSDPVYGSPASLLAELDALYGAHPSNVSVRERLSKALVNAVLDAAESEAEAGYLDRLRQLNARHPDDATCQEMFGKGIFNVHSHAKRRTDLETVAAAHRELRQLAESKNALPSVMDEFAKLLSSEVHGLLQARMVEVADLTLWELRSWQNAHTESGAIAVHLSRALAYRNASAHQWKDESVAKEVLDELRQLSVKYPAEPKVAQDLVSALSLRYIWGAAKNLGPFTDAALDEIRAIQRAQSTDAVILERLADTLSRAARISWLRLDLLKTYASWKELNALIQSAPQDKELAVQLDRIRRETSAGWSLRGVVGHPQIRYGLILVALLAACLWGLLHGKR